MQKRSIIVFIALAVLVVLTRLPSLSAILDTDSSVNAFFARQMLRGETLYDKFHPAHHLPGIYYTNVLALKLFGDTPLAPRLILLVFATATSWLLFLLGRSFFDDLAGILAAVFYVLTSSQVWLSGTSAEMEHFANLPLIATMFLFLILVRENKSAFKFIYVGLLGAACILYKVIFVAPLAAIGVSIFVCAWLDRFQAGNTKKMFIRLASTAIGVLLPLAFVGIYFACIGLWKRLMLVFTLGFGYFSDTSLLTGDVLFPRPFGFPLFMIAMNNVALLAFGLIGMYRLLRRLTPIRSNENLVDVSLVLWMIFSFALAGLRGGGFAHYVLTVVPPLTLMAGIEISLTYQRWKNYLPGKQALWGIGMMTFLIAINFFWRNFDLYSQYIPTKMARTYFENSAYKKYEDRQYELINYVTSHTEPDDFIYVWSAHLQEYYYADRMPPVDILWPEYVSATGNPERIFNLKTKYIIVDEVRNRPEWLIDGLDQEYYVEMVIDGVEIYRRK